MKFIKYVFGGCLFFCLVFACSDTEKPSEGKVIYQMIEVTKGQQQPWIVGSPGHYNGIFSMEEGAGSGVIHLTDYYDDAKAEIRFSGCVIIADDVAVKPKVRVFEDLRFMSKTGSIGNRRFAITPMKIRLDPSKEAIEGIVYQGIFFKKDYQK